MERSTRLTSNKYRAHYPESATERLFLPRTHGGRGLINLEHLLHTQIYNLKEYFHKNVSGLFNAVIQADTQYSPLNLSSYVPGTKVTNTDKCNMLMDNEKRKFSTADTLMILMLKLSIYLRQTIFSAPHN